MSQDNIKHCKKCGNEVESIDGKYFSNYCEECSDEIVRDAANRDLCQDCLMFDIEKPRYPTCQKHTEEWLIMALNFSYRESDEEVDIMLNHLFSYCNNVNYKKIWITRMKERYDVKI